MRHKGLLPALLAAVLACEGPTSTDIPTIEFRIHADTAWFGCAETEFSPWVNGQVWVPYRTDLPRPEWSSTDPTVATVDSAGTARVRGNGTTLIIAEVEGAADTAVLTVAIETPCSWRLNLGDPRTLTGVPHPPTIASDGSLRVVSAERLLAVTPTGDLKWSRNVSGASGYTPPAASPDGSVVLRGYSGPGLLAFDSEGDPIWQAEGAEGWAQLSAPAIDVDGAVYVSTALADSACVSRRAGGPDVIWRTCVAVGGASDTAMLSVGAPVIGPAGTVSASAHRSRYGRGDEFLCVPPDCSAHHGVLFSIAPDGTVLSVIDSTVRHWVWGPLSVGADGSLFALCHSWPVQLDAPRHYPQFVCVARASGALDSGLTESPTQRWSGPVVGPDGTLYLASGTAGAANGTSTRGLLALEQAAGVKWDIDLVACPLGAFSAGNDLSVDGRSTIYAVASDCSLQPQGYAASLFAVSGGGTAVRRLRLGTASTYVSGLATLGPDGIIYMAIENVSPALVAIPVTGGSDFGTAPWPLPRGDEAHSGRVRTRTAGNGIVR